MIDLIFEHPAFALGYVVLALGYIVLALAYLVQFISLIPGYLVLMVTNPIEYGTLLLAAVPVYWLSWRNLFKMALDCHISRVSRAEPGNDKSVYPIEYFRWLMIQLFPLCLLGLARLDDFIIGTRIPLLLFLAVAYVMVQDNDGRFPWKDYGRGIMTWSIGISLGIIFFLRAEVYIFLQEHALEWGYLMMGVMVCYMVFGQGATFVKLLQNWRAGGTRTVGVQLQFFRFIGFGLPAIHYGVAYGFSDSLFVVNALGMSGACALITAYLVTPSTPKTK